MNDQTNPLLTKTTLSSYSSNPSRRQLNESATFNGLMAVVCISFTCLFLWMTLDRIHSPDCNPAFILLIKYLSVSLASFFGYLTLSALHDLVKQLGFRKFMFLSLEREGSKWSTQTSRKIAATYAAISFALLLVAIDDFLCGEAMKSILGIKSPTAINMLIAKLPVFYASSYFSYLAILIFPEIKCKDLETPKPDFESHCEGVNGSEVVLSANEVPTTMV